MSDHIILLERLTGHIQLGQVAMITCIECSVATYIIYSWLYTASKFTSQFCCSHRGPHLKFY